MAVLGFESGSFELKSYHLLPAELSNGWTAQKPQVRNPALLGAEIQPLLPLPNHASWPRDDQTQGQDSFLQFGHGAEYAGCSLYVCREQVNSATWDIAGLCEFSDRIGERERSQNSFKKNFF